MWRPKEGAPKKITRDTRTKQEKKQTKTTNILFWVFSISKCLCMQGSCRTDSNVILDASTVMLCLSHSITHSMFFKQKFFVIFPSETPFVRRKTQTKQRLSDWFPLNYSVIENCFVSSINWRWTFRLCTFVNINNHFDVLCYNCYLSYFYVLVSSHLQCCAYSFSVVGDFMVWNGVCLLRNVADTIQMTDILL